MNTKLKKYRLFGMNWYPALMAFQMGMHMVVVTILLGIISYIIYSIYKGSNFWCWSLCSLIFMCVGLELMSVLWAFDDKLAKSI